jgi:hypothetical protein
MVGRREGGRREGKGGRERGKGSGLNLGPPNVWGKFTPMGRLDSWRRRGPKPASLEAEALQEPWAEPNRHIERRKTLVA